MEFATIIAALALLLALINSYYLRKHNRKILEIKEKQVDLEERKLISEIGTLEDIKLEMRNLEIERQEKKSDILKKWSEWQKKKAFELTARGMTQGSEANDMKRKRQEEQKKELAAEDRRFKLEMQKLKSKENLLRKRNKNK